MSLAELEKEILSLSTGEFSAFTRWLDDYSAKKWDQQFEQDIASGKLERLGQQADIAFESGKCTAL
jgi:hypothetical protein